MVNMFEMIGYGQSFRYLTGSLDITGAVLLLVPRTAAIGGGLLAPPGPGGYSSSVRPIRPQAAGRSSPLGPLGVHAAPLLPLGGRRTWSGAWARAAEIAGEASMLIIWLGALFVVGGVVLMAAPPIWRGRLSERRSRSAVSGETLEPRRPGAGFGLKSNWPGLALIALGAILLLVGAAV